MQATLAPGVALRTILRHMKRSPLVEGKSQVEWHTDRKAWADSVKSQFRTGSAATDPIEIEHRRQVASDYAQTVASTHEWMRLTVNWGAVGRMTDMERVRATANRVGLQVPTYASHDAVPIPNLNPSDDGSSSNTGDK